MAPVHSRLISRLPLDNDALRLVLCELKEARTLMRLRSVCHAMKAVVDAFSAQRYNVDKMLCPFVGTDLVLEFRRLQAELGFIFSGSRVAQFFEDNTWADASDLDVYLYAGTALAVGGFLMTRAGYVYDGRDFATAVAAAPVANHSHAYNTPYIRHVYKFTKGDLKIDLVVATESPVRTIIHFHSTPVINGISWDQAFSLFATASWTRHDGMVLVDYSPTPAVEKYRERGFTLYDGRVGLTHSFHDYLRTGYRYIGDSSTWVVKLNTAGIAPPATDEVLSNNSFEVTPRPTFSKKGCLNVTAYEIEDTFFTHHRLAKGYTLASLAARFAGMVIHCLSQRFSAAGVDLDILVSIGGGDEARIIQRYVSSTLSCSH
ncbi:hypothetical protein AURDEDRAFT_170883 [Auricularia subglabra TFB-10046 SS5]|nr:hypothetical protein AURDEDRAFT_170883 [Auricularia subglabra TFB-10046 SS5]